MLALALTSCKKEVENKDLGEVEVIEVAPPVLEEYGFVLNDFEVIRDTIRSGDIFGKILDTQGITPGKVYEITEKVRETLDPTKLIVGKPYTVLRSKDSARTSQFFIYENDRI